MYVCLCHGFTDGEVNALVARGCRSVAEVYRALGGPPQCGKCTPEVRTLVKAAKAGNVAECMLAK